MNVNLTPRLEAMVRQKVEAGLYNNASEVVRAALRLMDEQDRMEQLRAAVALAEGQVRRGEIVEWTPDLMERLKRQATENARQGKPIPDEVKP